MSILVTTECKVPPGWLPCAWIWSCLEKAFTPPIWLKVPIVEGVPVGKGSTPPGRCLDAWDVILTLFIKFTPVIELLPICKLLVSALAPFDNKYCGWSSRVKFNKEEWSAEAFIAGALNPTTGLWSLISIILDVPCWTTIPAIKATPSVK